MNALFPSRRVRSAVLASIGLVVVCAASATRVGSAGPTAASAAQAAPQQPAHVQSDESASLRQGTIGAVDARGARVQVQGVWLDLVPGTTKLIRDGRPAALDTLKAGEAVRFTVAPGTGAASTLRVIYAP